MAAIEDTLRTLPAVHLLVEEASGLGAAPRWAVVEAARRAVAARRASIVAGEARDGAIAATDVAELARGLAAPSLRRVINATGVVLHTNLGRAPLAAAALAAVIEVGRGYANLEYDLERGERGSRHGHLAGVLRELCGADDAAVVNNNAAACMLALAALAAGREVIVSRGELVEIGGSFRVPDILRASGCRLVEVGTTNKTRLRDYEDAITPDTALLLKVHRSNFAIVGFTEEAGLSEIAALSRARGLASMIDLGSGALADVPGLGEPTVTAAVASGVDLVCFSGDKLLGGPQAGVIVGRAPAIERVRAHPLMRAMRPDKLTIAALAATLALYREGRAGEIPAVAMLACGPDVLRARADKLAVLIGPAPGIAVVETTSTVGGGASPLAELPSWGVAIAGRRSVDAIDRALRAAIVPVVARVIDDRVVLDVRAIADDELEDAAATVRGAIG